VDDHALGKTEFWMRVAGVSFTLWAGVVAIVGWVVQSSVQDAVRENKEARNAFTEYVRLMERRVTIVEERQSAALHSIRDMDTRLDTLEGRGNGRTR
jgi:hypothetical protein